jgi:type I restriction enzyme S subunit
VIGGRIDTADMKLVEVSQVEAQRLRLRDGDLLFVRTNGNPNYVGRSAVFEGDVMQKAGFSRDDCLYASYLIRARLRKGVLQPKYLQVFLATFEGRKRLREQARTSAGQYNINTDGLSCIRVLVPPQPLQAAFEDRCVQALALQEQQRIATEKATGTFASLLSQVFSSDSVKVCQSAEAMVTA